MAKDLSNPLLRRYSPMQRYESGDGFAKQSVVSYTPVSSHFDSLTDKEAYKLSLASKRSSLSTGLGSTRSGQYMFESGVYDPDKDMSYFMRSDLTPQEIDRAIELLQLRAEDERRALNDQVNAEIEDLKQKKAKATDGETSAANAVGSSITGSAE